MKKNILKFLIDWKNLLWSIIRTQHCIHVPLFCVLCAGQLYMARKWTRTALNILYERHFHIISDKSFILCVHSKMDTKPVACDSVIGSLFISFLN